MSLKAFGCGVAVPFIVVGAVHIFAGPATVVQPIEVSDEFKKSGYTEQALQRMLVDTLGELRLTAKGVTPESKDAQVVLSEFNLPDFSMPGTGFSMRSLIDYARALLKLDSSVYGSMTGTKSKFSVDLTLRDPQGEAFSVHRMTSIRELPVHGSGQKPTNGSSGTLAVEETLRRAAMEILKHQSVLLYADNLLQNEQHQCFSESGKCDFREVQETYDQIAAGVGAEQPTSQKRQASWLTLVLVKLHVVNDDQDSADDNAPWAELMLSKIYDLVGDYGGAVKHARMIVERSRQDKSWAKALPWAYYNWGVALNDLGCYAAGAEVLTEAVNQNPQYAPAHNALSRSYNALAEAKGNSESTQASLTRYRAKAQVEAEQAIKLNPSYQEAYVNLGDALRPPLVSSSDLHTGVEKAREMYQKAIALNAESAGRARQQLALMPGGSVARVVEWNSKKRPECRKGIPRSLLEASGCSDAEIRSGASRRIEFISAERARVPTPGTCNELSLQHQENNLLKTADKENDELTTLALDVEGASHKSANR